MARRFNMACKQLIIEVISPVVFCIIGELNRNNGTSLPADDFRIWLVRIKNHKSAVIQKNFCIIVKNDRHFSVNRE